MDHKQDTSGSSPLILVLGGARSGKSTFAERLAAQSDRQVAFIATATDSDEDMHERIERHRIGRPQHWHTIEEPLHLSHAITQAANVADILLLDCMTVWLSNWLFSQGEILQDEQLLGSSQYNDGVLREVESLLSTLALLDSSKTVVIVSNEVGLGIVPAYALGRLYRDLLGRVNQRLALAASCVYFMVAGLGVDIKRLHNEATL